MKKGQWGIIIVGIVLNSFLGNDSAHAFTSARKLINGNPDKLADHCRLDALTTKEQAVERNLWAAECGYFGADLPKAKDKARKLAELDGMYLVFTGKQAPEAPIDRNASCDGKKDWSKLVYCVPGCYSPGMRLKFEHEKLEGIGNAMDPTHEDDLDFLKTLTPEATPGSLSFKATKIHHFTFAMSEGETDMVTLKTKKGRELQVTTDHPLVGENGKFILARDLKTGTALLDEDGQVDTVEEARTNSYRGFLVNVGPESQNKKENILIAEGLLTGSHRFQSEWGHQVFRFDLRETLDISSLDE